MRMILSLLAVWQVRLARLDLARGDMLADDADAALVRARQRLIVADRLAHRAGFAAMARRAI